ncbi:uncharacterized protein I303_104341 [Kwoniella dejecticola CBS 10117]|uniref:C2H2-type domain-containing protein n=1 Tax=Kwoniella dejecticola CBS 10117 TaxID=1296121 RepID=A0A1A6A5L5_9TREE|nr:uncharacterized protein I303_04684 [Kwoniella dejecticola CBS 10117]OBR85349.1 hypothetical protein I303_04684 [Kwoniella dejecticola CBS 10117]
MPSPPPQPVPAPKQRTSNPHGGGNLNAPQSIRMGASPMSYGAMTGISFTNGGGFSFENKPRSVKWGNAGSGPMGSYGARFYGDAGGDSPTIPFSTSITMDPSSFAASAHAFNLPSGSMSSSYNRRSYAAVASSIPRNDQFNLSSSFASMSFQPMSLGTSYSKSQVTNMMKNKPRSDAELTQAYECCGTTHSGLHALLEHVEDCHPFSDPNIPPDSNNNAKSNNNNPGGFSPVTNAMDLDLDDVEQAIPTKTSATATTSARSSISPNLTNPVPVPSYPLPGSGSKATTPTEQASIGKSPLKLSDVLKSPPEVEPTLSTGNIIGNKASNLTLTRTGSAGSSPPEGSLATPTTSTAPSPVFTQPKINAARPNFLGSAGGVRPAAQQMRLDRAFNEVVAGPKTTTATNTEDAKSTVPTAVAPGVLFASAVSSLGIPTIPPGQQKPNAAASGTASGAVAGAATGADSGTVTPSEEVTEGSAMAGNTTPNKGFTGVNGFGGNDVQLPQPSLFSSHRPWRCPNPGCNKAYKQSNGLKYHQMKGQCDFAIHDAVDLGLSVEEAEERNRPFVCAVGAGCNKRYRQMNGLKYHYLNSGEHGQYGLRMLQNGTHPHPPSVPTTTSNSVHPQTKSATSTPTRPTGTARPAGAPYAIPSHANAANGTQIRNAVGGHGLPRMGTWPAQRTVNGSNATPNSAARPVGQGVPVKPAPQPQPTPITKGRDAVLFAAVGEDPMDVIGRMDS